MSEIYCTDGSLCLGGCAPDKRKCEHVKPLSLCEVVELQTELAQAKEQLAGMPASYVRNCEIYTSGKLNEWLFCEDKDGHVFCRLDGYSIMPKEKLREHEARVLEEAADNLGFYVHHDEAEWQHKELRSMAKKRRNHGT